MGKNMENKFECEKYVDKLREEYLERIVKQQERDELIADNNIEKRDINGYHGREILELLQNADDAYQKSIHSGEEPVCDLEVLIEYKSNILRITNTGTTFDKEGIKAIVQGNNSPKAGKYIGNKGTGFRSILNWAESVKIYSGNFNVEFSKEVAEQEFEKIKDEPKIKEQLKRNENLYIPMLTVPKNIENGTYNEKTVIEVVIDETKINDDFSVSKQIENIDLRILLFLPNVTQIEIITDEEKILYKRIVQNCDNFCYAKKYSLEKIVNENKELEESFYLFEKEIPKAIEEDNVKKDIWLAIAVPTDYTNFEKSRIYSFFPLLDTESPFDCVLHATYALGDQRNTINFSENNKTIVKEQLKFLIEVANKFVENGQNDIAYKLIVPSDFSNNNYYFMKTFAEFNLKEEYLELLCKQKIFLTVNGKNISIEDNPKLIEEDYPELFCDETFGNLLQPFKDKRIKEFVEFLARQKGIELNFDEIELCNIINKISSKWNTKQQVEVFIWWNRNYSNLLPNLLKTENGNWLRNGDKCYFLVGNFYEQSLPEWVKIPALDKKYQQELFSQAEKTPEVIRARETEKETKSPIFRIICQQRVFSRINFTYNDRSTIISTVNSSVYDKYDNAVDFVKWLWKNYRNEKEEWNPPEEIKFKFPNASKQIVQNSEMLFFGSEYGNPLAEKLFDDSYGKFPDCATFGVEKENEEKFKRFISKFGVNTYPKIEVQEVKPLEVYSNKYKQEIKLKGDVGSSTYFYYKYNLPYIKSLENLLMKLSTLEIVEWIHSDIELFKCLGNPFCSANANIKYMGSLQRDYRLYYGIIKNYILEVFNESKWLEIHGNRYSPRQVLKYSDFNKKFFNLVPVIDNNFFTHISENLKITSEKIKEIFEKFDFSENVTELSSQDFYGLMLNLPQINNSQELSRSIYRIIESSDFKREFEDSVNKKVFFNTGKLLVKHDGIVQYYPAKEAVLPSSKIINKKKVPILEKGPRTNNDNFVKLFGCKKYEAEYSVVKNSISVSKADKEFQEYFGKFQKYALAFSARNKNIENNGKKLKITLVNEIVVSKNNEENFIEEEYSCIRDAATNWYITSFGEEYDKNRISEIIEDIYSNIANTPGFESDANKIGELFRAENNCDREFLIKKEFGSLSVINDDNYKNELKTNFIETLTKIAPDYNVEKINVDFDDFNNIQNSECIITLFKELNTDIEQFNNLGFEYEINLIPYYEKELENFIQSEKENFKNYWFSRAKENDNLQNDFIDKIRLFENFEIHKYENSVNFDIESKIIEKFGEWRNCENLPSAIDEYGINYEKMNPEHLYKDEISTDTKVQTMIYFYQMEKFNKWLEEQKNQIEDDEKKSTDIYEPYRNIVPQLAEITYTHPSSGGSSGRRSPPKGSFTLSNDIRQRKAKKEKGNIGELLIYKLLCKTFGEKNVFPRSEAFVELNILKPGQAVSGDYDLSYKDETGKEYFIEVKTSDGNSFFMSQWELEFAKGHSDCYKLFVVELNADSSEKSKYEELPMKFWEDEKFRKEPIIERIKFEF